MGSLADGYARRRSTTSSVEANQCVARWTSTGGIPEQSGGKQVRIVIIIAEALECKSNYWFGTAFSASVVFGVPFTVSALPA